MRRPLVLAHRGARYDAPENTIPAFIRAMEQGADGVELDVQRTRDGHLVVAHDEQLGRTIRGDASERLTSFTLAQLRERDAGGWFGDAWIGTPIPTLDEVFDALPATTFINIELKRRAYRSDGLEADLLTFLQRRNVWDRIVVSSFNPFILWRLRHTAPRLRLGLLYDPDLPLPLRRAWARHLLPLAAIHPHTRLVTAQVVRDAHRRGWHVTAWTANTPAEIERLASLGVDAIITDTPKNALSILSRYFERGSI